MMTNPILRKIKEGGEYSIKEIMQAVNAHGYGNVIFHTKDHRTDRATIEISVKVKEDEN
jgi:hypothetical protein